MRAYLIHLTLCCEFISIPAPLIPIADTVMAAAGYRVPVPPGVDPNFGTQGGAPLTEAAPEVPANPHTHPNLLQPPASAGDGAELGIETPAVDAVPA